MQYICTYLFVFRVNSTFEAQSSFSRQSIDKFLEGNGRVTHLSVSEQFVFENYKFPWRNMCNKFTTFQGQFEVCQRYFAKPLGIKQIKECSPFVSYWRQRKQLIGLFLFCVYTAKVFILHKKIIFKNSKLIFFVKLLQVRE